MATDYVGTTLGRRKETTGVVLFLLHHTRGTRRERGHNSLNIAKCINLTAIPGLSHYSPPSLPKINGRDHCRGPSQNLCYEFAYSSY